MGNILAKNVEQNEDYDNRKNAQKYKENMQPRQKKKQILPTPPVPAKCNFVYIHPKIYGQEKKFNGQEDLNIDKVRNQLKNEHPIEESSKNNDLHNDKKKQQKSDISRILVQRDAFIKMKKMNYTVEYIHIKDIGRGSYSKVCKLKMKKTGLQRAAKVINCPLLNKKQEEQQKALNQVLIPMKLDHPNIKKIYEVFLWKNKLAMIMELCEGGDLFQFIKQSTILSQKKIAQIMRQILSAVVHMHSHNIVHRDLRPENILYEKKTGVPKIIDFGSSTQLSPKNALQKLVGCVYYTAPEVIKRNYDEKCDVWSCGVILYVLLCGRAPFYSEIITQIPHKILYDSLEFSSNIWIRRSPQVKQLISTMLEKNPSKRINASEAYNSRWFKYASEGSAKDIQTQFLGNLSNFHFKNKIKAVVYTYIASQLYSNKDKEKLLKAFREFDKNGNGVIEKKQLMRIFEQHNSNFSEAALDRILQLIDTNDSGLIDFTQFLVAASNEEDLTTKQRLQNAFLYLDTDKNGFITIQQIKSFLFDGQSQAEELKSIFAQADKNGDGKLTKKEFIQLIVSHNK